MKVDEGLLQSPQFPRFSVQINPSPTTDMAPPLPKRARVLRSYSLDDLALGESYQSSSKRSFSIREKVAESRMRGLRKT